jgi:hypothetical protein
MPARVVHLAIVVSLLPVSTSWAGGRRHGGAVHVRAYINSHGTYIGEHMRSAPDGNVYNNWSTKGNANPYTGKWGWITHDSNLGLIMGSGGSAIRAYDRGWTSWTQDGEQPLHADSTLSVGSVEGVRKRSGPAQPVREKRKSGLENASVFARKGFDYFKAGDFERAATEYTAAIRESANADFYYGRGAIVDQVG